MSRWFRVYENLVDDPKVQRLNPALFKALVNLWCLASQNDGLLPSIDDIAFKLRMSPDKVGKVIADLRGHDLLDIDETGISPHNWSGRQYQSDSSSERVRRHRAKRAKAGLSAQWQAPSAL